MGGQIVNPLPKPDSYHFDSAEGWLMLGNPQEAELEWNQIDPRYQNMVQVIALKWSILAKAEDWTRAAEAAMLQCEMAADDPSGYVHWAYSVRRQPGGGLQPAWDILHSAYRRFPKESIIPYNLACYAAQMGQLEDSWEWLQKAIRIAGAGPIKTMAMQDADLAPLWPRIEQMP